jgi:dihydrodipicolinate synthase/N-acetylneuraminate lyase
MTFEGIIPAVTTPFAADGSVDTAAITANVAALVDAGVHGIIATGTMGEAGSLTADERGAVVRAAVAGAAGRVPVTVGVSSATAAQSLAYALDAKEAGATGIMSLPPLLYRADDREVLAFFTELATVGLPLMAYNNPEASGVDMSPELIVSIHEQVDGVVAIKECSGDARRLAKLLGLAPGLEVLVGGDDWALEGFCAGATGWVTGVADVVPAECVRLYELCRDGDLVPARELYQRMLPLARFDMTPKLVQYFKAAMDLAGSGVGGPVRAPRLPLTEAETAELHAAMEILRAPAAAAV